MADELVARIVDRLAELPRIYSPPQGYDDLESAVAAWLTQPSRRTLAETWLTHCQLRQPKTGRPDSGWALREYELRQPLEAFLGVPPADGGMLGRVRPRGYRGRWR
jgi:hypothetical protein